MKSLFTLEYKLVDSKGREKRPLFVGVYKTLEEIEKAKEALLKDCKDKISFQVYTASTLSTK